MKMEFKVYKLPRGLNNINYSNNFFKFSKAQMYITDPTYLNISGIMLVKFFLSPFTKRNLKDSLPLRDYIQIVHDIKKLFHGFTSLFLAFIDIKIILI